MLHERVEVPRPLDRFLRLTADDVEIVGALARFSAARELAVPEIHRNGFGRFFDGDNVGTLAIVVVIDDEAGEAVFQMPNEVLLNRVIPDLVVFPPTFLSEIDEGPVKRRYKFTVERVSKLFARLQ